ncbi:hypothetical protein [Umezawaea sp. Da 62-37]|uniref:hypothetical protein n=1 Tax=Umezawaea sp. Da 62-37 TaxID=3075927 RepID=UPI0028F7358A|nr:hypothetical protein [Umezawaea sp. Da 62-37]WNV87743.1 hypothetical protein RM788_05500 [Umezawaea sp. Da 62-37]
MAQECFRHAKIIGAWKNAQSDRGCLPLAVGIFAANRNDHLELEVVVDAVAPTSTTCSPPTTCATCFGEPELPQGKPLPATTPTGMR